MLLTVFYKLLRFKFVDGLRRHCARNYHGSLSGYWFDNNDGVAFALYVLDEARRSFNSSWFRLL